MGNNTNKNYIVPLGQFRGEVVPEDIDPIWVWIHEERGRQGLTLLELGELADVTYQLLSKAERGGPASIKTTRAVLRVFGRELIMVDKEDSK